MWLSFNVCFLRYGVGKISCKVTSKKSWEDYIQHLLESFGSALRIKNTDQMVEYVKSFKFDPQYGIWTNHYTGDSETLGEWMLSNNLVLDIVKKRKKACKPGCAYNKFIPTFDKEKAKKLLTILDTLSESNMTIQGFIHHLDDILVRPSQVRKCDVVIMKELFEAIKQI